MRIAFSDFDYTELEGIPAQKRRRGNQGNTSKYTYKDAICAFDIETSSIPFTEHSFMYIWQFHINGKTIIGRTWEQFLSLCDALCANCEDNEYFVVYVHNLSYEFQFLSGIYRFSPEEVFSVKSRKVLKCEMFQHIEFRCSYFLTNSSLDSFTRKMQVVHSKKSSIEFDHKRYRTPDTVLTEQELEYAENDVLGLVEAIQKKMKLDGDNLYTIPLTSTGYVRRDTKTALRFVSRNYIPNQIAEYDVYIHLREAFRGGNTHANRYYTNVILENVFSADRSSSYPDVQCNDRFPVGKFQPLPENIDEILKMLKENKKAMVFRAGFYNIRLTNHYWGFPYLPKDKSRNIHGGVYDNGRILEAEYIEITITDVDFRIILNEYTFDNIEFLSGYYTNYGYLPPVYIHNIIRYYKAKTELKGIDGEEYEYMKSKELLNAIYGMSAQDPVKQSIDYIHEIIEKSPFVLQTIPKEELYNKYLKKAWLPYQWGVWTTAHARFRLEEGLILAGEKAVYCDTDSVKYLEEIDWSEYNGKRIEASEKSGAFADDPKGITHHMGVFEQEKTYKYFKTMGAKKYAYQYEDGVTHTTIAGVNKKLGGKELEERAKPGQNPLELFAEGFVFRKAGGTESIYNDHIPEYEKKVYINGREHKITKNITIKDSEYTIGLTEEYRSLLSICDVERVKDLW